MRQAMHTTLPSIIVGGIATGHEIFVLIMYADIHRAYCENIIQHKNIL